MPFSHHSHSGQFCNHAENKLEEMVQTAISKKMSVYCLTEHMPRGEQDLYPEEIEIGRDHFFHTDTKQTSAYLFRLFDDFYKSARALKDKYKSQITLLIGTEIDWIRQSSQDFVEELLASYQLDLFVGSVHHVHTLPIDYTFDLFQRALEQSGGSSEQLYEDYFDAQYAMLQALKPPIVGHFDLIRLKSDAPNASFKVYPRVWMKIVRNIKYVIGYGGVVEINSAALRKGLEEPFPSIDICKEIVSLGGSLTISDDAHSIGQVGTYYKKLLACIEKAGIDRVVCCQGVWGGPNLKPIDLTDLKIHPFFAQVGGC